MLGNWYARVRESYEDAYPATTIITQATDNMRDDVLLTRRGNTIYVHLYKDMQCSAVILKPLNILPTRAVLLNDGRELETRVDLLPSHHRERPYLRISGVPVNEYNHEVMVIRLDFDESINA